MSVRPIFRPVPVAYADYDVLTDVLSGIKARRCDFVDPQFFDALKEWEERGQRYPWEDFKPKQCWRVAIYDNGMDMDADGNSYFDDWPSWFTYEYHTTQRGAELAAMSLLSHHGIPESEVAVEFGWQEDVDYDKPIIVD